MARVLETFLPFFFAVTLTVTFALPALTAVTFTFFVEVFDTFAMLFALLETVVLTLFQLEGVVTVNVFELRT